MVLLKYGHKYRVFIKCMGVNTVFINVYVNSVSSESSALSDKI